MKPAKKKNSETTNHQINGAELREKIESRAYQLWLADGCPQGEDLKHWLQAEREVSVEASAR